MALPLTFDRKVRVSSAPWLDTQGDDFPLCSKCVQVMVAGINLILAEIEKAESPKCTDLCSFAPAGGLEFQLCSELCELVGVGVFMEAVKLSGGADFIAPCDALRVCKSADCPSANPTCVRLGEPTVSPASAAAGTAFQVALPLNVSAGDDGIGASQLVTTICPTTQSAKDCAKSGQDALLTPGLVSGAYPLGLTIDSTDSPPGDYVVTLRLCEGTCTEDDTPPGTQGPHGRYQRNFGSASATFTVTQQS